MASRNQTLKLSDKDRGRLMPALRVVADLESDDICPTVEGKGHLFFGDSLELMRCMPDGCIDAIIADPPYPDLRKAFGSRTFFISGQGYREWLEPYVREMARILNPEGSIYLCGDWRGGADIQSLLSEFFIIRNRITWEREKGRGAKANWKNSHEDIWYATASEKFHFDLDSVKLIRRVLAPYRSQDGEAKDWNEGSGGRYRITHPGNCWTDISVPFWSMPENTDHPTQKPEKLVAKLILASTSKNQLVFDPFGGSGTTAVTAKKLGRRYISCEIDQEYALLAARRLEHAEDHPDIQGVVRQDDEWYFLERNTPASTIRSVIEADGKKSREGS